jgi:hypothetical protein
MGFQQPPTLPDYSKLVTSLNASNVQKWNPELYSIIKQLIQAVDQSQTVITSTPPPVINPTAAVSVDPLGAIYGDGTVPFPLGVKVDGSTIFINAFDQIQAVAVLAISVATVSIDFNSVTGLAPNTTIATPVANGTFGYCYVLGWAYTGIKNGNTWTGGGNLQLRYNGTTIPAATNLAMALTNAVAGTFGGASNGSNSGWSVLSATPLAGLGISVSLDSTLVHANTNPPPQTASCTINIAYVLL